MKSAGTLTKRQKNKDGTYSYKIEVMARGKRHTKTVRCRTDKEAEKERLKFYTACQEGLVDYGSINWQDLCDIWAEQYAKHTYKASTLTSVMRNMRNHVKPAWNKQAKKITRAEVQIWVNSMDGVSPKTVRNIYAIARSIFTWAVKKELIASSPCEYIDMPRKEKPTPKYLKKDDIRRLLEALDQVDLKYKVALYLALFGGFRKGEILGLTWEDIDLNSGRYKIEKNRHEADGGGFYVDSPKTTAGIRQGLLPANAIEVLKQYKEYQQTCKEAYGDQYANTPYIVRHDDGTPLAPNTIGKWVVKFRRAYGLPEFSLHSLRHTHASLMRYLGADLDEIQAKLGHADKSTTQNIYVHMFADFDDLDKSTTDKIGKFIDDL